ncbi:DUF92 domain-containing protein [Rossellomorea aquimaris]|uniref:DUF92 domain-containing protein n=1 Tax=Rossellomorea aquimaris TaxID=189382 RepID=UPI001E39BB1D|nr:DUF92 domain-containing protein [Rossellomorea aquimaris]
MGVKQIGLLIFIIFISIGGWRTKNLSLSGSLMALLVGCMIGYSYGMEGLLILGVFFLSSSIWSHLFKQGKIGMEERLAKSSVRDWQQVLANGGPAALFAFLYSVTGNDIWTFSFVTSIAAANSDTWASEIGPLSKGDPLSIRTFKRVPKGTSGAISFIGTVGALLGSAIISFVFFFILYPFDSKLFLLISCVGFLGNVIDTLLGAYWQLENQCCVCHQRTERKEHCHQQTARIKGYSWLNNEWVNASSCLVAGVIIFFILI